MKEIYVVLNPFTKNYIYYETKFQRNRIELGQQKEGLLKKLSNLIDKKRKSTLHLVNIPDPFLRRVKDYFSENSRYKILIKIE